MPAPWEQDAIVGQGNSDPIIKAAPTPTPYKPPAGYTGDENGLKPIPGGPADKPKEPEKSGAKAGDVKLQQKRASLTSLVEQINRVQDLYNRNLRDEAVPILSALAEYLPTPTNRQFDAASAGLAEQGLSAFRVPGVGAQSDTELRQFVQANKPSSSSFDTENEERLRQLRVRVDATLAEMGLPPANWTGLDNQGPAEQPAPDTASGGPPTIGDSATPWDNAPPAQQVAAGPTANEFDAQGAGFVNSAVQQGLPYEQVAAELRTRGYNTPSQAEYTAALRWQQQHPNSPYNAARVTRQRDTTALEQFSASALGTGIASAIDAGSGFTLDNITGAITGDPEGARQRLGDMATLNPGSAMAGTLVGGVGAALGIEAGLARAGMKAGLPRAIAADSAYGAGAGAGATDNGNRALGALGGAAAGAAGSFAGQKVGNALAALGRGVGGSVNTLRNEGVNALTMGQTYGGSGRIGAMVKGVEDRIEGLPVAGDVVKARRREGYKEFNSKAFDKALEPIGETVGGQVGENAVQTAQERVSAAFRSALAGKGAVPDQEFVRSLEKSVMQASRLKGVGEAVKDDLSEIFAPFADDAMLSGEALDAISRNLRDLKARYAKSPDALQSNPRVGKAIDSIERAVFDLFDRQAAGTIPDYRAARAAYRRVSILEDAVLKARNQDDRMFTPAQLGQADRANAKKFTGKRTAARGDTPFHDYQTAAQEVLPNKVPDSGTAGRLLVPLALVSGGTTADQLGAGGAGLTIGGILAALYTRQGQRLLTKPGRGVNAARRVAGPRTTRALGAAGGATGVSLIGQQ